MRCLMILSTTFCCLLAADIEPAQAGPSIGPAPTIEHEVSHSGFTPPPMDLSHVRLPSPPADKIRDLPARFDWREAGLVSPIKNQGGCGSCYAFAAAADVESRVLDSYQTLVDISENHLKECHFEGRSCLGGNAFMMTNLLTLQGAVLEDCDPYVPSITGCSSDCEPQFSVFDWIVLTGNSTPPTGALKQALADHGPLSTTVFAGDGSTPSWNTAFNNWSGGDGLYFTGTNTPNHAVTLVGWDDDHPHAGGGQGCWIVKNSWGAGWGDACGYGQSGGYFYIAYGSASLGQYSTVITEIMPSYPELSVMAWDEGGWTNSFGASNGSTVIWGMARFDPADETHLHRVEFWTNDATERVDVYVYSGFAVGTLTGLLAEKHGSQFGESGYHSVPLDDPLPLLPGNAYYVAVRLENASADFPLVSDCSSDDGSGRTWISLDGVSWHDMSATFQCAAGIRIRTSPHEFLQLSGSAEGGPPAPPQSSAVFELEKPRPNPFNPRTSLAFTIGRAGPVRLRIYDLQGRLVSTILDAELPAGRHQTHWSGRDDAGRPMPAGVYHCRLEDGLRWRSQRLVLVK